MAINDYNRLFSDFRVTLLHLHLFEETLSFARAWSLQEPCLLKIISALSAFLERYIMKWAMICVT